MAALEPLTTTITPSVSPPPNVTILPATKDDISVLGRILTLSHGPELVMSFFFLGWPSFDAMLPYYAGRIASAFEEGNQVFKAVLTKDDGAEGEIVGLVRIGVQSEEKKLDRKLVVREERVSAEGGGEGGEGEMILADITGAPKGVNMRFVSQVMKGLEGLDEIMIGRKYYLLSSLAVLPAHQGKGIGKLLMDHCNAIADKSGLPTYLTAFPGAYGLYLKMGYNDMCHFDIDLGAWSKAKYRGFGVYRSYGMLREAEA